MRVTIGKTDYMIDFEYQIDSKALADSVVHNKTGVEITTLPNVTVCKIAKGRKGASPKEMSPWIEGKAIRSVTDTFVKETGRKMALTRALQANKKIQGDKALRTAFWNAYWNRKTPKQG